MLMMFGKMKLMIKNNNLDVKFVLFIYYSELLLIAIT